MKKYFVCLCSLSLLSFTLFAQEGDPKQRAKQSLALRAAAQDVVQLLNQQSQWDPEIRAGLSRELSQIILADLKTYRQKAEGKAAAEVWLVKWRVYDFDVKMGEAMQAAQLQSPLKISVADVLKRVGPEWQSKCESGAKRFSANAVDLVYPQARQKAVEELKRQMDAQLQYPGQAELDKWLLRLDAKRKGGLAPLTEQDFLGLKDVLEGQVVPFEVLLEELDSAPGTLAEKMLKDFWNQYQMQIKLASGPLKLNAGEGDVWVAADIKKRMDESLQTAPAANHEARPPVYGVFEAVFHWAEDAASDWEKVQLAAFLQNWEGGTVTNQMLETWIKQDLSLHLDLDASAMRLREAVKTLRSPELVTAWMIKAPESRRQALQSYYLSALEGEGDLATLWQGEIDRHLNQQLPPVRQAIARQQLETFYPDLFKAGATPESVLLWFYDRDLGEAREVSQINQAYGMKEDPDPLLLAETQILAIERLNAEMVPGLKSLSAQIEILREMEKEGMDELKASVARGEDAEDLYEEWREAWQQRWQGIKETQDPRWQEMMGRTGDELRKTVRQWYESVKEQLAEREVTALQNLPAEQTAETLAPNSPEMTPVEIPLEPVSEPDGAEEEPVTDLGDTEGEEPPDAGITQELEVFQGKADGVLAFSDLGNGDCRLLFGAPDGKGALSVGFDPENVEDSARKIAEALRGPLRDVLNGTASANEQGGFRLFTRAKEPTISMLFQVDSPKIRHQMSIRVRQFIQQDIDAWAAEKDQKAPALLWQDEMGVWQ